MGRVVRAGTRPEGCQHGRAAGEVLPIEACHCQAKGALSGDAVAERIAAVAPVCDADSVCAQTPDAGLEWIAARSPFIAKFITCLRCIWEFKTLKADGFSPPNALGSSSVAAAYMPSWRSMCVVWKKMVQQSTRWGGPCTIAAPTWMTAPAGVPATGP